MKVLLLERNLILLSKIKNSLDGYEIYTNKDYQGEDVVIMNLEAFPLEKLKSLKSLGAIVIGYCGHKNLDLIKEARESGADLVIPNSQTLQIRDILKSIKG